MYQNPELNKLTEIASGGEKSSPVPVEEVKVEKVLHPDVKRFLEDREVRPGLVRVPFYKFFIEYTRWVRKKGREKYKLTHIQFGKEIKPMFEQRASGHEGRVYMLNNCFKMEDLEKDKRNYDRRIKNQKKQVQEKTKDK